MSSLHGLRASREPGVRLRPNNLIPTPVKKLLAALHLLLLAAARPAAAQTAPDPWRIAADKIDQRNSYGATVSNGMLGIV